MRLLDSRTKQSHRAARGTLVARLFRSTAPSALAILVLTLFATTPPAWAQHPGNEAPHVVEQFLNMQTWGDPLAARIVSASGYSVDTLTDYGNVPTKHYQGIARGNGPDGTPYLFLTRNRNPAFPCVLAGVGFDPSCFDFGPGEILVIKMGSRSKDGERFRSNRLMKGAEFEDTLPSASDKVVKVLRLNGVDVPGIKAFHPSGLALIDGVLLMPYASGCGEANGGISYSVGSLQICGEFGTPEQVSGGFTQADICNTVRDDCHVTGNGLLLFDVRDPENPVFLRGLPFNAGDGAVAATRMANGHYLIAGLIGTGSVVGFYETDTTSLLTTTSLFPKTSWAIYDDFGCVAPATLGSSDCGDGNRDSIVIDTNHNGVAESGEPVRPFTDDAQGISLIRESGTGKLYMFLMDNTTDLLSDGDDMVVMLEVDQAKILADQPKEAMTYLYSKHFEANDAGQGLFSLGIAPMGDFEAATAMYVSTTGQLMLYASMHDGSSIGSTDIVEMGEFRNSFVAASTPVAYYANPYCLGLGIPSFPSFCTGGPNYGASCSANSQCPGGIDQRSSCGTIFEPYDTARFTPPLFVDPTGPNVGPVDYIPLYATIDEGTTLTLKVPAASFVQPWVMLFTEYDSRSLYSSADPKMSLMMDWPDRSLDDFNDLSEFDSPGSGTFDDDAQGYAFCGSADSKVSFYEEGGGGCQDLLFERTGSTLVDFVADVGDAFAPGFFDNGLSCVKLGWTTPSTDLTPHWHVSPGDATGSGASYTFAPPAPGTYTIDLTVGDKTLQTRVAVRDVNDPPTADAGSVTTPEDTPVAIVLTGSDQDSPQITFVIDRGPSHGTLSAVSSTGNYAASVTYTPGPDYFGPDSFTFKTSDGLLDSQAATVNITVQPVNDGPTAQPTAASTDEDNAVTLSLSGGDIDSPDASVHFVIVGGPTHGVLGPLSDNGAYSVKVTYTPGPDYFGADSFTFRTNDGLLDSPLATVSITVRPVNDAPTAQSTAVATDEDNAVTLGLSGGDVDSPDASVGFLIVGGPLHGSLGALSDNGAYSVKVTYTPNANYFGTDSFTFRTNDGLLDSPLATATITVRSVDDAPVITLVSPRDQSLQYSDAVAAVTITAEDVDTGLLSLGLPALASDLSASGGCEPAQFGDSGSPGSRCTWTVKGQMLEPAGSYPSDVIVSDGDLAATDHVNFDVGSEDAMITIDPGNTVAEQVVADGGNSGTFTLAITLREIDDPDDVPGDSNLAGDITRGEATMTLVPVGPGSPVPGLCTKQGTTLLKTDDDSPYDYRELRVECAFAGVPVNTYAVAVDVIGLAASQPTALTTGTSAGGQVIYYHAVNAATVTDVLTVYDPSLGFTTGGGWFYWPGTADDANGYPGDKTNFGYVMKYNRKQTNLQGSLLMIRHLPDGGIVRVKSNALEGLSLSSKAGPFGWASFTGKATYQAIGWPEPQGNFLFTAYAEDHGTPGAGTDRFWIQVTDKDAVLQPDLSLPATATANAQTLAGGNIQVP